MIYSLYSSVQNAKNSTSHCWSLRSFKKLAWLRDLRKLLTSRRFQLLWAKWFNFAFILHRRCVLQLKIPWSSMVLNPLSIPKTRWTTDFHLTNCLSKQKGIIIRWNSHLFCWRRIFWKFTKVLNIWKIEKISGMFLFQTKKRRISCIQIES